jgi:hypothetical protein
MNAALPQSRNEKHNQLRASSRLPRRRPPFASHLGLKQQNQKNITEMFLILAPSFSFRHLVAKWRNSGEGNVSLFDKERIRFSAFRMPVRTGGRRDYNVK